MELHYQSVYLVQATGSAWEVLSLVENGMKLLVEDEGCEYIYTLHLEQVRINWDSTQLFLSGSSRRLADWVHPRVFPVHSRIESWKHWAKQSFLYCEVKGRWFMWAFNEEVGGAESVFSENIQS